jgi:hypothetical protein
MVGIMAVVAAEMMLLLAAEQKMILLHGSSWCVPNVVACSQPTSKVVRGAPAASGFTCYFCERSEFWLGKRRSGLSSTQF